jgi:NAD dependent epimerase/dehydratase family enzyme
MFGEMAKAVLLEGQLVKPKRLLEAGYSFRFPDAENALRDLLEVDDTRRDRRFHPP